MRKYKMTYDIEYKKGRQSIKKEEYQLEEDKFGFKSEYINKKNLDSPFELQDAPEWLQPTCHKFIPTQEGFGVCMDDNNEFWKLDIRGKKVERKLSQKVMEEELIGIAVPESDWYEMDKNDITLKVEKDFWTQFKNK